LGRFPPRKEVDPSKRMNAGLTTAAPPARPAVRKKERLVSCVGMVASGKII
jgi:hypothetical protein